jgi:hypothetical protein
MAGPGRLTSRVIVSSARSDWRAAPANTAPVSMAATTTLCVLVSFENLDVTVSPMRQNEAPAPVLGQVEGRLDVS